MAGPFWIFFFSGRDNGASFASEFDCLLLMMSDLILTSVQENLEYRHAKSLTEKNQLSFYVFFNLVS